MTRQSIRNRKKKVKENKGGKVGRRSGKLVIALVRELNLPLHLEYAILTTGRKDRENNAKGGKCPKKFTGSIFKK